MTRLAFLLLTLTVMWPLADAAAVDRSADDYVDLRGDVLNLPYAAEIIPRLIPTSKDNHKGGQFFLFFDFNRDGQDDLIRADSQGLLVEDLADSNRILAQIRLDTEYAQVGKPAFNLTTCPDLNQDGHQEFIAIGHTDDRMTWQMWVLDSTDLSIISKMTLPAGREVRKDGRWDGAYQHAGYLASTANSQRPLLILTCDVGHDRDGRGVLGIDPLTGQVLWQHEVAGRPRADNLVAGDLDNDGRNEIVLALELSSLPRGREINGYHESDSQIVVLNEDGSQRWSNIVSQGPGGCEMVVVDANGEGPPEIVATHWTTPLPSGGVHIWNLSGELLGQYHSTLQLTGIAALDSPAQKVPALLVSTSVGMLEVLRFEDDHLAREMNLEFPYSCAINGVLDLLPEFGPEIVVTDKSGRTVVLNGEFEPLAQIVTSPVAWQGRAGSLKNADGTFELFRVGTREGTIGFQAVPMAMSLAYPVLALVAVLSVALIVMLWLWLRYRRRNLDPDIKREVRLHLLESLQLSRHGDIAPLNSIRRLNFCLRALKSDIGDTSRVRIRLGEILTECQDAALPHLAGIMDRARLAGLDSHLVKDGDHDLAKIGQLVHSLVDSEDLTNPSEQLVMDLYDAGKNAERSLRNLRREAATHFQADPQRALERVLKANRERLRLSGIRLVKTEKVMAAAAGSGDMASGPAIPQPLPDGTFCQIDTEDLVQVLDNVIANATAAMQNTATRELSITQQLGDGMVLIDVTDTGCGIARENHERAMSTHYTTRPGGGMGLPGSRKILRRYSGQISILCSEPGRGTTIRITTIAS